MLRGNKRPVPKAVLITPPPKVYSMHENLDVKLHNRFDIEVIDSTTGGLKLHAMAENVICSQLWTRMFTPATYFNNIHYGTGAGTPSSADTSLFTFLGYAAPSTRDDVYTYDWDNGIVSLTRKIQLSETTAVGSTLTEVGIGYDSGRTTLCTHAMLKDMNGNEISIEKTSTDIINIYATVFLHFGTTGYDSGTIKVAHYEGNTFFLWALGMYASRIISRAIFSRNWFAVETSSTDPVFFKSPTLSYSAASKVLTVTVPRLAVAEANVTGIRQITFGDYFIWSPSGTTYYMSCPIFFVEPENSVMSTALTGEALGTGDGSTTDFKTAFPFIDGTPTVYADGVKQTGVTFSTSSPAFTQTPIGPDSLLKFVKQVAGTIIVPSNSFGFAAVGATTIYEFVDRAHCTITSFSPSNCTVYVSEDMETWTKLTTYTGSFTHRYWKLVTSNNTGGIYSVVYSGVNENNVHFATAPASGAVLTIDYTTKRIAKDVNHVFDLSATFSFGEYTA